MNRYTHVTYSTAHILNPDGSVTDYEGNVKTGPLADEVKKLSKSLNENEEPRKYTEEELSKMKEASDDRTNALAKSLGIRDQIDEIFK